MPKQTLPTSTDQDLYLSWDQYHDLIEALALKVYRSGYVFDSLLCLSRGGLRVGDVFSRIFDLPLAILAASSYRQASGTQQGELNLAQFITTTASGLHGRLLLVDDLVDSGVTLAQVAERIRCSYPMVTDLRTAVIWQKAVSRYTPDYCVQYLPTNPWIHQPFEIYDGLGPEALAKQHASLPSQSA